MKTIRLLLAALLPPLIFFGCESFRDLGLEGRPRKALGMHPQFENPEEIPEGYSMYVTAFEYPEGYDYIRDTLHGAGATISLYRAGEKVLSMPADGLSPDECRVVGGRLYTPGRYGGATGISCDGEPLLRYDGEESLVGIVSDGESLFTLGRSLSGAGFCCRKNGVEVFSSQKGVLVGPADGEGALRLDGDDCVFFYGQPLVSVAGDKSLYYMVRNGEESQLGLPGEAVSVFDAVRKDGEVYVVASTSANASSAALYSDGGVVVLSRGGTQVKFSGLRLFFTDSGAYVTGFQTSGSKVSRMVWNSQGKIVFRIECYDTHWIYPAPSGYYAVEREGDEIQFSLGVTCLFRTPARFWSSRCATYFGGGFYAALLDEDGRSSTVYRSDGTALMTVKGVITELCFSALIVPGDDS